ncbi:phage tail protein [Halodesulfovibrio aestuarii]|uniref:Phage tail-collar fibre protein n=1 Tax=Halodesulfovibrio aestuarii TaxID=126333 RepID=A0A8G2FA35_9BACT|nr:phage tail protein [Halodesulfovibrio aestuarii]SHI61406.1 Phage tail-collar fibre protein [Halodesulfovibrio aestuarii]
MSLFLTKAGLAALVEAEESGTKLQATHMALGDGHGSVPEHTTSSPSLINEVWRGALQSITINEQGDTDAGKQVVFEAHVPINAGGWYIREVALYAGDVLLAIGTHPVMWKPAPEEPTKMEHVIKAPVTFSNADSVSLIVDPAVVLASQAFVKDELAKHDGDPNAHSEMKTHMEDKGDPHGTIPDGGETGQVLLKQEDGSLAWGTVAGVPVGQLCFSTNGAALPGTVPVNVKQKVRCDLYPQLFEWMKGSTYLTDESAWDAEATAQDGTCGKYCWDGGDYFILPCYTRYFAAAHAGKEAGSWDGDAIRNITGRWEQAASGQSTKGTSAGAITALGLQRGQEAEGSSGPFNGFDFDASREVPIAEENRPKTSYVLPCIKAFDVPINAANVDIQALAQQVAAINGNKVDRSEWGEVNNKVDKSEWVELVPDRAWRFPNGLIIQTAPTGDIANNSVIAFPVAFNAPPFSVVLGDGAGANPNAVLSYDKYSFKVNTSGSAQAYYFAIGR